MSAADSSSEDRLRRKIVRISALAGGVAAAAAFVPVAGLTLIRKLKPPEGDQIAVDISTLAPGQILTVDWHGKPVWVLHRTPAMLASLTLNRSSLADPDSDRSTQPEYCRNEHRSLRPEYFVAVGLCTHLGCAPTPRLKPGADEGMSPDWNGGFLCPCHTSMFDLAGRTFRNREAKDNLAIPPYRFLPDGKLSIGENPETV